MDSFLKHVKEVSKVHNVALNLVNEPHVYSSNVPCSGFFIDYPTLTLSVATQKPQSEWLEILVHEYNHMIQYVEKRPVWDNLSIDGHLMKQTDLLDLWLSGIIELNEAQLNHCIDVTIDVELDCEISSVNTIKEFSLPIDIDQYIKKANSYVLFYHVVKKYRKWSKPGRSPYMIKEVLEKMPKDFSLDYKNPPLELLNLIEKHCISFY